jgi:hypothetical protein
VKQGQITLFPIGTTYLEFLELTTSPGKVWVKTENANGVGSFNPADKSFHFASLPHNAWGGMLVANGRIWSSCMGEQPGVYSRPVTVPPAEPFHQHSFYELGWLVFDLARGGDGALWAAVSKKPEGGETESNKGGFGGPAEAAILDRIIPPPSIRLTRPPQPVKMTIDLPAGWNPLYLRGFPSQPGRLYVIACTAPKTYAVGRVSLSPRARGRVETLLVLPTGVVREPLAASDGTLWIYGNTLQGSGWMVALDTQQAGQPREFDDPARSFYGLAEGVDGRMFLLRHGEDASTHKPISEILLFKMDPVGGAYGPVGSIKPPKFPKKLYPDSAGSLWFLTREPLSKTVFSLGLGRFDPPNVDPLNPDG